MSAEVGVFVLPSPGEGVIRRHSTEPRPM